jgi:glutaredoxin
VSALGWDAGGRRADVRVRVFGRPGCHLCDDAVAIVAAVCGEIGVGWDEVDVTSDAALLDRYSEEVPVVVTDGIVLSFWRVDAARLRAALTAPTG